MQYFSDSFHEEDPIDYTYKDVQKLYIETVKFLKSNNLKAHIYHYQEIDNKPLITLSYFGPIYQGNWPIQGSEDLETVEFDEYDKSHVSLLLDYKGVYVEIDNPESLKE